MLEPEDYRDAAALWDVKHVYVQKGCLDLNGVPAGGDGDVVRPARIHSTVEISNDAFDIVRRHRAMFLDVCFYCGDEPRPHARRCSRFTIRNKAKHLCAEPRDEAARVGLQRRRDDFPYVVGSLAGPLLRTVRLPQWSTQLGEPPVAALGALHFVLTSV